MTQWQSWEFSLTTSESFRHCLKVKSTTAWEWPLAWFLTLLRWQETPCHFNAAVLVWWLGYTAIGFSPIFYSSRNSQGRRAGKGDISLSKKEKSQESRHFNIYAKPSVLYSLIYFKVLILFTCPAALVFHEGFVCLTSNDDSSYILMLSYWGCKTVN